MFPPFQRTVQCADGFAVHQEDGDGGTEWHVYATTDPDSYIRTVPDINGRPAL
jgi:hypothetical protein